MSNEMPNGDRTAKAVARYMRGWGERGLSQVALVNLERNGFEVHEELVETAAELFDLDDDDEETWDAWNEVMDTVVAPLVALADAIVRAAVLQEV